MSRNYDNWERLVAAVIRREEIWQLCHENSRTPSLRSSISSDINSSSRLSSSFSRPSFDFLNPKPDEIFKYAHSLPFQTFAEGKPGRLELLAFSLKELLMAPCIVLGDELNTFMNTYIVKLKDEIVFVVKRLRRGKFARSLYEQRIKDIRSIEHENVVKLRGCYWSAADECFGFYDYFPQGSVYTMLQGQKGKNRVDLDWETRMRIAVGAAKGLAHIHTQQKGRLIHGNLKASNIFLNPQRYGCLTDMNFGEVRWSSHSARLLNELSQESDVYSFGQVLIELISGRSASHFNGRHATFAEWALHIARDEWTALVFDKGLLKDPAVKQEMWDMLAVALSCIDKNPEKRPKMNHVLEVLELICTNLGV